MARQKGTTSLFPNLLRSQEQMKSIPPHLKQNDVAQKKNGWISIFIF
jgi:hypothetical protein